MKKIVIVTIIDYKNYGNRLQNYALEQLLSNISSDINSGISYRSKENDIACSKTIWKRFLKQIIPFGIYKEIRLKKKNNIGNQTIPEKRIAGFESFSNSFLHMLPEFFVNRNNDLGKKLHADYYVAGSDQIWNPAWAGHDHFFLTFAPPEKRIAFAASFGVEALEPNVAERYVRLLKDFKYISVRERSGAKLVKQLTGKDVDVVLDPTLLLSRDDWEKIVKRPAIQLPEQYVLAFFLGEEPKGSMEHFADQLGLPIVHMNREEFPELFVLDPAEFLYVVKHADYVLTDSFHGTVFSIKFEREFYVFQRKQEGLENMFTRISDLLQRFHLEDREQSREEIIQALPLSKQKWEMISGELDFEREKTMDKMREIMNA